MTGTVPVSPHDPGRGPAPFPWADVMGFGLGVLRLSPSDFWAMTPRELDAALLAVLGASSPAAPARSVLDLLMQRYPDSGPSSQDAS